MLVYIICSYQEDGPENLAATTDPAKVRGLVEAYYVPWSAEVPPRSWPEQALAQKEEDLRAIDALLAGNPGAGFSSDLGKGWGGLQLHVVELT